MWTSPKTTSTTASSTSGSWEAFRSQFTDDVLVHVVATRTAADETILDLASNTAESYVLSNDRFGDYNDKPVIKHRRTIRHEIVDGCIFVHDLNVKLNYRE